MSFLPVRKKTLSKFETLVSLLRPKGFGPMQKESQDSTAIKTKQP